MSQDDFPILGQVAISYCPLIGPKRTVMATRLTVSPLNPNQKLDAAALLAAIGAVWPAGGADVLLAVRSETLLADLMGAQPTTNVMVEVPAFMAADEAYTRDIRMLHVNGNKLLLAGRPGNPLARELLPCFTHAIVDLADERRLDEQQAPPEGVARTIGFFQDGVASVADMEGAFKRGARGVLGWPIDDVLKKNVDPKGSGPDLQVIVELIRKVDQEESIDKVEATLRRDPALAFKLMRQINSPAFGLSVEITSFSHAVMLLGYQRLKRWLALLLATASKDANLRPVMYAAVRRGLLMEAMVGPQGDETLRGELFICGVFSLLDRMFGQPFSDLLRTIPVPERVYEALARESGPYEPYITLARLLEGGAGIDIADAAQRALLDLGTVNHALLKSLGAAMQVE